MVEDLEAVERVHLKVEDDEVGLEFLVEIGRFSGVRRRHDREIARSFQHFAEEDDVALRVVHDEDASTGDLLPA